MLVRFRRFRHILIFERRAFTDRLILSLALGAPLTLGVASRILLRYDAADLTLEGAFLVGLIAGPYSGAIVGALTAVPAHHRRRNGARCRSRSAAGLPAAACASSVPKEAIWHFSPFVFSALPRRIWHMARRLQVDWQIILVLAPIALELLRQAIGLRFGPNRLFYLSAPSADVVRAGAGRHGAVRRHADQDLEQRTHRASAAGAGEAAARGEDLGAGVADQPALPVQHADLDLVADPLAARNRADGRAPAVGAAAAPAARSRIISSRIREELEAVHEYLDIEVIRFGPQLRVRTNVDANTLDVLVPSMILQPLVENCVKHGLSRKVGGGTITIRAERNGGGAVIEVVGRRAGHDG